MPRNEMLDEMLDQVVKRIQHSIQHSKTKFVFDLDQTSSNINLQMLDDPTWVVKRIQHFHPTLVFSMLDEMLDAFDQGLTDYTFSVGMVNGLHAG